MLLILNFSYLDGCVNLAEITFEIRKPEALLLVAFLAVIFILEAHLTLTTPISFGDEGYHTSMARWIAQNVEYPVWTPITETDVWKDGFTRPPFWNILEGGIMIMTGMSEITIKLLTPLISVLTGIATYITVKHFYNPKMGALAAIILVTIPSFVTYSVLFYTDALVTFFTIMFVFTFALSLKSGRNLHMLVAGAFGALAFMTKLTGYAAYAFVILTFLYYFLRGKKILPMLKHYLPMIVIMLLIPAASFLRSYVYYGTPICYGIPIVSFVTDNIFDLSGCQISTLESEYSFEGRTEKTGSEANVFDMGLSSYLEFAYGNIWFIIFALMGGLFIVGAALMKKSKENIMNFSLIAMMLIFAVLFFTITKRAEDTARYSLMWTPIIAIIAAKYFDAIYNAIKSRQKHLAVAVFIAVVIIGSFTAYVKIDSLYAVKNFSPSFFEACDWIDKNLPEDALITTVWSYRASYNCNRATTGNDPDISASNNVTHILQTAKSNGITHIFIQKFSISNQALSESYSIEYINLLESNPETFVKIYENGPSLQECVQKGYCDGNIIYEIVY